MATQEKVNPSQLRVQFFNYLFGDNNGHLCLGIGNKQNGNFRQQFYEWPAQRHIISNFIDSLSETHDIWFCVNLLRTPERKKEFCLPSTFVWADLDAIRPEDVAPAPTCVVQSSTNRYQAYWRIEGSPIPPEIAEDYSRRLAYSVGADKSGWDLTQLLRVPWTNNFKYEPAQAVRLLSILDATYEVNTFDDIIVSVGEPGSNIDLIDKPKEDSLPTFDQILYKYKADSKVDDELARLISTTPPDNADWSRILWRLIHKCLSIGMTREETYVVTRVAKCNKYWRDNRLSGHLWRDIVKAEKEQTDYTHLIGAKYETLRMPHLVDFDELEEDSFIKDYKEWANNATDAPEQYHELTCFITLSAALSAGLYLKVDWGEIIPNLWGLVLGESTLTRKTTAMNLAMDIIADLDRDLILASDGSAEGLLTGLSLRPKRVSIFYKDEVSGFFDSINRKDYLAGMPEVLTKLYDVPKIYPRMLRKETITITEPYFIFFGGGIRDKVYSLVDDSYIISGFLPRFLIVSGENDLSRLRRTGPPTVVSTERKDNIVKTLTDLRERYTSVVDTHLAGQPVKINQRIEAKLTPEAWEWYGDVEELLTKTAADSDIAMTALPTLSRMGFSMLKMSLLVAATRRQINSNNTLDVELSDVKQAAFYIQKWGQYTVDFLLNAGHSAAEKQINRGLALIKKKDGITRAEFMQRLHLSARESKELIDTLVMRGLIDVKPAGRGFRLYAF